MIHRHRWVPAVVVLGWIATPGTAWGQDPGLRLRVQVDGVQGDVRRNVLAVLTVNVAARERDLSNVRIRRLHARAPAEIELALEPFGYYDPQITSTLDSTDRRWTARYTIDPGPQVQVTRVHVGLGGAGANEARIQELARSFPLSAGNGLSHALYEQGKLQLLGLTTELGYLDARFDTSEIRVDLENRSAEIALHLETGPQFLFGPVSFQQDLLDSAILAGFVTFRTGQPFNINDLLNLQAALSESPYFSRVEVEPRRDLADGLQVPIDVDLVLTKPQRYLLGGGYGTNTGPRGTVGVEFRRLNRGGHRLEGEVAASSVKRSVVTRYIIPSHFPRTEVLTFTAGYADIDPTTSDTRSLRIGAEVIRSRGRWRESFALMYDHEAFEVGADTGTTSLVTLGASWTRLRTNDRIFPTRGFRIRFDVLGAHDDVLSSETFLQVKIAGKLVRSIGRTRFLARAEVGRTFTDNFRGLPPTVRFFTGGDQSVRGYQYQSLAPVDEAENVIGGKVLVTSSAELEHRFLEKWGLAGFLDAGNSLEAFSGSLETGLGGGMRWLSPIGMVRLDVAFALSREGNPARLHITIGPDL